MRILQLLSEDMRIVRVSRAGSRSHGTVDGSCGTDAGCACSSHGRPKCRSDAKTAGVLHFNGMNCAGRCWSFDESTLVVKMLTEFSRFSLHIAEFE